MTLWVRTLGEIAIGRDGDSLPPDLHWKKHTALLVYLACSARGRTRDHLAELLWPKGKGARSLNQALVPIRRALPEGSVHSEGDLIRLERGVVTLDVEELRLLAESRRWRDGAALVGGDFCEGLNVTDAPEFEHWLGGERARWRQLAVLVLVSHARERVDEGDISGGLQACHRARDLDPLSEPALLVTLRAMALAGQRGAALEAYQGFLKRLRDEVGAEPSPETRAVAQRIRAQHSSAPAPAAGAGSRRAPLVGRAEGLATLTEGWTDSLRQSRAGLATIEGDAGVGKSRLAEEFLERARLDGAVIAQARLVEADRDTPESVLTTLARGGLLDAPGLAAADPGALATLQQAVPEWKGRFPPYPGRMPPLRSALAEALRAVVDEHPVVLFVDDAQWADDASLLMLEAIFRDLLRSRLFLMLTVEPGPGREPVDRLRARVGRELAGTAVRLAPLGVDEIGALARWALPAADPLQLERVARRVLVDSAGLPLLAVELLHAIALGMETLADAHSWPAPFQTLSDTLPADLPDAVVAAIRVGYRRLSPPARELLAAVAVLGEKVSRALLARATELPADTLDGALDELEWQRWLEADARGYAYVARVVRQVVDRDMVSHGQRQRFRDRCQPDWSPSKP